MESKTNSTHVETPEKKENTSPKQSRPQYYGNDNPDRYTVESGIQTTYRYMVSNLGSGYYVQKREMVDSERERLCYLHSDC